MVPLAEIFEITYGHSLELNRLKRRHPDEGGIAFISCKMGDNGISAFVEPVEGVDPSPGGELTCALSGNGVLSTFLQETRFYTGFHVARLIPVVPLSKAQLLYYCSCIVANRYRFSYGRQANRTLKSILVPAISEIPAFVEGSDVNLFEGGDQSKVEGPTPTLDTSSWLDFQLGNLFDIRKGRRLTKANMLAGDFPFVGASDTDNGVTAFVGQNPIHQGGTISVSYNGSVAEAFYQPMPFWASDDVNVLYPVGFTLNSQIAVFLCTIIRMEKYRFNYGRKWHLDRMRDAIIRLPSKHDGDPDWEFMQNYINTLPFSSQL